MLIFDKNHLNQATFLQVVRNPDDDSLIKAFVDSYDFVFMPVLNPDGMF